jgi:hypothetical protein
LYDWVKPYFPVIGTIIKTTFDVVIAVVETVIDIFTTVTEAIRGAVKAVKEFMNIAPGESAFMISGDVAQPGIPAMAEGGTVARSGRVLVGETAPEILDLPAGARVTPLDKVGNTTNYFNIYGNSAEEVWALLYDKLIHVGVIPT